MSIIRPPAMDSDVAEFIEMTAESNPAMPITDFISNFEAAIGEKPKIQQTNYFLKLIKNNQPTLKVINYYAFGEVLGKGSFGQVYKCAKGGREYAVKCIDEALMSAEVEQAFADSISAQLNSKFLVRYFEKFRGPSGELYVVMELCQQGDLRKLINTLKQLNAFLSPERITKILIQLLLALDDIHIHNILHRDLKPENVFVDQNDNAKIGDFGCAKVLDVTSQKANTMIGTPVYESPEIVKGEEYNSAADMWALGVLVYELCVLERPFNHVNRYKLQELIIAGKYMPVPAGRYPDGLVQIIASLLTVNPKDRPSALLLLRHPYIRKHAEESGLLQYYRKAALSVLSAPGPLRITSPQPTPHVAALPAPQATPYIPPTQPTPHVAAVLIPQAPAQARTVTARVYPYPEEERRAFVKYINGRLGLGLGPPPQQTAAVDSDGDEIFTAVSDGVLLCRLINCVDDSCIDERALYTTNLTQEYRVLANLNLCLNAAKAIGCSIVNIKPRDILEGRQILIFSLLWQTIRIELISKINLLARPELSNILEADESLEDFHRLPPEQVLLRWFNFHLAHAQPAHARRVANFTSDMKDGENYAVLLTTIAPQYCDRSVLKETEALTVRRAERILQNAGKLGCGLCVAPTDIVHGNSRLNLMFTAQLFNACPNLPRLEGEGRKLRAFLDDADKASHEEASFRHWINNLGIDTFVCNLFADLQDGIVLLQILDKITPGSVNWKQVNKPPVASRYKRNENANYAIGLAKVAKVFLVGIGGADITSGKKQETLAVVWQLRRKLLFSSLQNRKRKEKSIYTEQNLTEEANGLVATCKNSSSRIGGLNDPTLKNSRFLLDLVSAVDARAVDEALYRTGGSDMDNKLNAMYAIGAARKLGAPIYCSWDDLVMVNPKMIATFIGEVLLASEYKIDA